MQVHDHFSVGRLSLQNTPPPKAENTGVNQAVYVTTLTWWHWPDILEAMHVLQEWNNAESGFTALQSARLQTKQERKLLLHS